jgi:hemerythrin superfamily protein
MTTASSQAHKKVEGGASRVDFVSFFKNFTNCYGKRRYTMDATQLLKKDHKEMKALFKEFERRRDRTAQKKQPVVAQICHALTVHAQLEEELIYPVLKEVNSHSIKDLVAEAAEEHQVAKILIRELTVLSSDDEQYDAKVTVLGEYVQHHIKEEEKELFPKAHKHLSAKRLEELGEAITARRRKLDNELGTEKQAA